MIKLYYDPITVNCRKVLAGFDLAGVEFDSVKMDYFGGDHKQPDYLAVNPNAAIPALTDGDFVLWESNAMLQYGADLVGAADVYPTDVRTRADINRWHLWEASAWFPSCYVYLVENLVKPFLGNQPDAAVLEGEQARFDALASIFDGRHRGRGSHAFARLHQLAARPLSGYPRVDGTCRGVAVLGEYRCRAAARARRAVLRPRKVESHEVHLVQFDALAPLAR